ncbi:MAG: phosphoenolpyruvate--protein phosphotransferase [Actinomycetota bacterium]
MPDELKGVIGSPGVAAGSVKRMGAPPGELGPPGSIDDPAAEIERARAALAEVASHLDLHARRAHGEAVDVLEAEALMARDPVLDERIDVAIASGLPAPHAIHDAMGEFRSLLVEAGGYLAERAADLDDIRNRAVAHLLGMSMPGVPDSPDPFVLVATDLAPADTVGLDQTAVVALVTSRGGPTSHTAIIAHSLGLPAIVACPGAEELLDDQVVVVDADRGVVIVDPDDATLAEVEQRRAQRLEIERTSRGPGQTSDGHPVSLLLNIGESAEVAEAPGDGEGVGLLRTEFLFLGRENEPTVSEQAEAYRGILRSFEGRKVVVRTLDAGADKPLPWLGLSIEENPALGLRGLRTSRTRPDVLDGQLEAISRAAKDAAAEVWVMAPMVATATEAADFVERVYDHGLERAGVMVEIPALAVCAREVAAVVDFFSIGTNDLTQYLFATDRMVGELGDLLDHWHPALTRLIATVAEAGIDAKTPVGVCGESASDPLFALVLVGLGVTSLSMSASSLAYVRATLHNHSIDRCRSLAKRALQSVDGRAARAAVAAEANLP